MQSQITERELLDGPIYQPKHALRGKAVRRGDKSTPCHQAEPPARLWVAKPAKATAGRLVLPTTKLCAADCK